MNRIRKFKDNLSLTLEESDILEDIIQCEISKLTENIAYVMIKYARRRITKKEEESEIELIRNHIEFVQNLKKKLFENSQIIELENLQTLKGTKT